MVGWLGGLALEEGPSARPALPPDDGLATVTAWTISTFWRARATEDAVVGAVRARLCLPGARLVDLEGVRPLPPC